MRRSISSGVCLTLRDHEPTNWFFRLIRPMVQTKVLEIRTDADLSIFNEAARRGLRVGALLGFLLGTTLMALVWLILSIWERYGV